tara:strand:- start:49 stop:291 length:243 start_codon:yes stop_codon:yes gene_type:complete
MPRSVIDIEKLNNKSAAGVLGFPMKMVGKAKKTGTGKKVRKVMNVSGVKLAKAGVKKAKPVVKAGVKKGKKVAKKMKKKM